MSPKIRNIVIFTSIGTALVLIYFFFIRSSAPQADLVSSPSAPLPSVSGSVAATTINTTSDTSLVAQDFLALLLNVKDIKLDDSIFSDPGFQSLHDSTIILTPDTTTGRSNPFAPLGVDNASSSNTTTNISNTPISPPTGSPTTLAPTTISPVAPSAPVAGPTR